LATRDNQPVAEAQFLLEADAAALAWLEAHPSGGPRVIAYDVHRCCGGGKICQVDIRDRSNGDASRDFETGALEDGTTFLIDRRAARRLPSRFRLTVRGVGWFKHLDLVLDGEQWGDLLYS
jgi:hypothetical protein